VDVLVAGAADDQGLASAGGHAASRAHPLIPEQKLQNATLARIRIVVENTLAEMKRFRILADVFRHPVHLYDAIFVTIAGFVTHRADQRLVDVAVAAEAGVCLFCNESTDRPVRLVYRYSSSLVSVPIFPTTTPQNPLRGVGNDESTGSRRPLDTVNGWCYCDVTGSGRIPPR